jgi:hypothetical protein
MDATVDTACLIATVKDEGPWLLEWVAHNRAIGFAGMVVASNDCTDGTDAMLDRLQAMGWLRHVRNAPPWPNGIQVDAYEKCRRWPEAAGARWLMALDADEFLNIHAGAGRLDDLLRRHPPEVEAIIVNWRVFGDSGLTAWQDAPVCETFVMAAGENTHRAQVKTLFRNHQDFTVITPHGPWRYPAPGHFRPVRAVTAAGLPVRPDLFQKEVEVHRIAADKVSWSVAQVNHYIVKTRDVFDLKRLRGRAVDPHKERHTAEFFDHMNCNHVEDRTISRTAPARAAAVAELMADPVLARLHAVACDVLRRRLADGPQAGAIAAPRGGNRGPARKKGPTSPPGP